MDYISTKEASEKWNISQRRVIKLAGEGRIPGAYLFGNSWLIPSGSEKPADGRTKASRAEQKENYFRFPLFVNFSDDEYIPPLSNEELQLRIAQKAFYACDFEAAKGIFEILSEKSGSIYIRQISCMYMCVLSSSYSVAINWEFYYNRMNLLLAEDFPQKKEMELLRPLVNHYCGNYISVFDDIDLTVEYSYHPSVYYLVAALSVYHMIDEDDSKRILDQLTVYEMLCRRMEFDGYFFEAQNLHLSLFVCYMSVNNEKSALHHIKRMLSIAGDYNLLYQVAEIEPYYYDIFNRVFPEYPDELTAKIVGFGNRMYDTFAVFNNKNNIEFYSRLSKRDYRLVLYASRKYTYKQIAKIMNISEGTVNNRFNEIYQKLGVSGRQGLIDALYNANYKRSPGKQDVSKQKSEGKQEM